MKREQLIKIGTCNATHGVKGEIQCTIVNPVFDNIDIEYFIVEIDGTYIPFFIEEYRWKSDTTLLIKFIDIDNRQDAMPLIHRDIFLPIELCPDNTQPDIDIYQLNGFAVIDTTHGNIGTIVNIDYITPENAILLLDNQLIIPLHQDLVVAVNNQLRTITMNLPDGLLE